MLLLWRPHIVHDGTPQSVLGKDYQDISFVTSDGIRIRGWWIPAGPRELDDPHAVQALGKRTIILCHGLNGDKASDLRLVRDLARRTSTFSRLIFAGMAKATASFAPSATWNGATCLEPSNGCARHHPQESQKIFGLGVGLGSAALIAAAADEDQGQAIDAVAVFAPYDRVTTMIQNLADANDIPTVGWLATHVSLQMAGRAAGNAVGTFPAGAIRGQDRAASASGNRGGTG